MPRSMLAVCALAALLATSVEARAKSAPQFLARNGSWEINYDVNACHAIASFGSDPDKVILDLTKTSEGDGFSLSLFGRFFASNARAFPMALDFGLGAKPIAVEAEAGMAGELPAVVTSSRFDGWKAEIKPKMTFEQIKALFESAPHVTPEQEAKVTQLTIFLPKKRILQLQLGSMNGPMATMRKCLNDMIRSWGYDPVVIKTLSRKPEPDGNLGDWLRTQDYPGLALARGEQGIIRFRLDVSEDGSTTGCAVLHSTILAALNPLTCQLLKKRAKFLPALDAAGKPTKSYYMNSVRWRIPD